MENAIKKAAEIRKALHRRPETGNKEFETTKLIVSELEKMNIPFERLLETGAVALIDSGKPGPCVAFRADIDALPVTENTGCPFSSEIPGFMHACGHDVHTAALLGVADYLIRNKDKFKGKIKLIFQPDEEGDGGAVRLISKGVLEGVNAVFGCHVDPLIPSGSVGVKYGKFYAAADVFDITVKGLSGHGATPEKAVDALSAACEMVLELKALPRKVTSEKCVLSVGLLNSGRVRNVIPGSAHFCGITRTLGKDTRAKMKEELTASIKRIDEKYGTETAVNIIPSYMGIVSHDEDTDFIRRTAENLLGKENVKIIENPLMITEDFGYYIDELPGAFYHIGAGCTAYLHSDKFLPDEKCLETAVRVHVAAALSYGDKNETKA